MATDFKSQAVDFVSKLPAKKAPVIAKSEETLLGERESKVEALRALVKELNASYQLVSDVPLHKIAGYVKSATGLDTDGNEVMGMLYEITTSVDPQIDEDN